MPSLDPEDISDAAVGARLRKVRNFLGLSQSEAARQIAVTRERLASYEAARAPLPLGIGLQFCRQFIVSEHWLATGRGPRLSDKENDSMTSPIHDFGSWRTRRCVSLALDERAKTLSPRDRFSESFVGNLVGAYYGALASMLGRPKIRVLYSDPPELVKNAAGAFIDEWSSQLTGARASAFFAHLLAYGFQLFEEASMIEEDSKHFPQYDFDKPSKVSQSLTSAMLAEIAENWESLRERLEAATAIRGARVSLAERFGVTRQSVNGWLSGKSAPTADTALGLLHWVLEVEANQKMGPGRAATRPGQRPKERQSREEKPSSGPP